MAEDKKVMSICDRVSQIADTSIVCYMYDGCVVRCQSEDSMQEVQQSLRKVSTDIGIEAVSKSWRSPEFVRLSISPALLISGDSTFTRNLNWPGSRQESLAPVFLTRWRVYQITHPRRVCGMALSRG